MVGRRLTAALFTDLTFLFGNSGDPISRFAVIYHRADSLFQLVNNTPDGNSMALAGFGRVIAGLEGVPEGSGKDTLLFQSRLKKGNLLDSWLNSGAGSLLIEEG
jgi:hypothetical protein